MFRVALCLVFVFAVFQFSSCSSVQPTVSSDSMRENNPMASPPPEKSPKNIADENFEKDWKSKYEKTLAEMERNHRLWQESKIANYDFVIYKYAGGNTNEWNRLPVLIKIREGNQFSIEKVEKDKDYVIYSRTDGFEDFDTVDKLFNFIRWQLDNGKIVEAEYDKKFGYPKNVFLIFTYSTNHNSHNIAISKFEVIK